MDELTRKGVEFHGHLGPFLVIGLRMGSLALKLLGLRGYSGLRAIVETGNEPPLSCIVDGVQVATGCTLGKGNVEVLRNTGAKTTFLTEDRILVIELRDTLFRRILGELETDPPKKVAERIMRTIDDELFLIRHFKRYDKKGQ